MTTNTSLPSPVICDSQVRRLDGSEVCLLRPNFGDHYNLSTGRIAVARVIDGVRYDTTRAQLIVSCGDFTGSCGYKLRRLYRTYDGRFFSVQMEWSQEEGFVGLSPIMTQDEHNTLVVARNLVPYFAVSQFLREWYCADLLPRDDAFVQTWAEEAMSADECEDLLVALGSRYGKAAGTAVSGS